MHNHVDVQLQVSNSCDLHVNYLRFNSFLCFVSYSFRNLWKVLQNCSLKRETFLIPKFVIGTINVSNWTSWWTIQGEIVLVISNQPHFSHLSNFTHELLNSVPLLLHIRLIRLPWVLCLPKMWIMVPLSACDICHQSIPSDCNQLHYMQLIGKKRPCIPQ